MGCFCQNLENVAFFTFSIHLPSPYFPTARLSPSKRPLPKVSCYFSWSKTYFLFTVSQAAVFILLSSFTKWIDPLIFPLFSFLVFLGHLVVCPFPPGHNGRSSLTNKSQRDRCAMGLAQS